MNLDVRLTPNVNRNTLEGLLQDTIRGYDRGSQGVAATKIEWLESWPAFRQPDDSPAIACLREAANDVFGRAIPTAISGPSNIGNYLASREIGAMSGFGVTYDNVHAADEWAEIASIEPVYRAYLNGVLAFVGSRV